VTDQQSGGLLIRGIGHLTTNDPQHDGVTGEVRNAAVVAEGGVVRWVGAERDLPGGHGDMSELDVGGAAVVPGFVDAHTHVVFAGDRAGEFERRLGGEPYEDILASGGGIMATVTATRAADGRRLFDESQERLAHMLAAGTTTAEVKSGYGLDVATERRILETAAALDTALPIDLVPSFLGAHAVPTEWRDDRAGYLDLVVSEMLPACAPLARFADVFCDRGAFTVDEARRVLQAARPYGLEPRIHADQLAATGAAGLAAELGAVSADHLDHASDGDLRAMAAAGTVGVLLPGVSLSMRLPFPDPARLREAGVTIAIATDANPGTSYVLTMPFVVALAVLEMGMAPDEALWSATRGGALALRMPDRGIISPGAIADLAVLDADTPAAIAYRPDSPVVATVVKGGVVERDASISGR
jgi:imidazolonepropionase